MYNQDPNNPAQPGYPQQQPPAKKTRKWPWIVGGLLILGCCVPVSIFAVSKDSKDKPEASGQAPQKSSAKLNDHVRDGKFEFTVTDVKAGLSQVGDNPYLAKKAQGQFVVVTMTVQNTSGQPQSFSPSNQKLFDQQGRRFEPDTEAQIALGGSDIPVWDNINPGNIVTAKVVYDMPKDAQPKEIDLHDSAYSGGAKVSLTP
ncbi:conserved hypothetical protein [Segniliparus rotundus DSM 44985]|uniref:DUF4352 domain-containing protein n=1 Tax=Segniliparus rotundus (strain ATCC BAA-972 / CDC 1076 / CIP 108378 / DSM 44985 / JCM 13578) TaxID=640132 RepID=D6ZDE9_SEGRD|nr:DUF4352 domain-containing protein [Segniliparus rotundus]ADG97213.1 conserved hypothetical protein [Segniliparus rotundus DSM 44985]